jgi:hypothetical protein
VGIDLAAHVPPWFWAEGVNAPEYLAAAAAGMFGPPGLSVSNHGVGASELVVKEEDEEDDVLAPPGNARPPGFPHRIPHSCLYSYQAAPCSVDKQWLHSPLTTS